MLNLKTVEPKIKLTSITDAIDNSKPINSFKSPPSNFSNNIMNTTTTSNTTNESNINNIMNTESNNEKLKKTMFIREI